MGKNTKIEWADHTFNPWMGCTKVSPACDHCYAEALMDKRMHVVRWGPGQPRKRTSEANWMQPRKWNAEAAKKNIRYRVFCASLADVFDNDVPEEWRADLLRLIRDTPHLDWLLLTKRIGNANNMLDAAEMSICQRWTNYQPTPNVWLGATICNQEEADRDIPKLLATPAAKRFVSIEPLLGQIDFRWRPYAYEATKETYRAYLERTGGINEYEALKKIDWVIVGGESGPKARPMHPDWVRSLRDQCNAAGVAFHFKQWGEFSESATSQAASEAAIPGNLCRVMNADGGVHWVAISLNGLLSTRLLRVGKKASGRLLDGRTWDEVPA